MPNAAERLSALRAELTARGLAGFVVPLTDEHMSEYVGEYAKRLEWLTGFTGSAGSAVVLADSAAIFVDGRYTLQVRDQVDGSLYEYQSVLETSPAQWLGERVGEGQKIGFDPWYHTRGWVEATRRTLAAKGAELVAVESNPVDAVWADQPKPPLDPILVHDDAYTGMSTEEKLAATGAAVGAAGANAAVIAALDSVAWLFNIRGTDVACTPVARAFALSFADGRAELFTEAEKITPAVTQALGDSVTVHPRERFADRLAELGAEKARVLVDPESTVFAVFERLEAAGAVIIEGRDPCVMPKAIKNPVEIAGSRAAHIRDGVALSRFLHWLHIEAPKGTVTELDADARLLSLRQEANLFRDVSFPAITGAGPNGAIVHYRSTPKTNRPLKVGELFLIDSGGQYLDGTTDVTRTVAVGTAGAEERDRFTRVLKGHIALATARFPSGTTGRQLDALARLPLWLAGLDYDHGTGHGVGSYLSVHEGPQRIGKTVNDTVLTPGMILSNEPGYYKTGAYGIRIENLVLTHEDRREGDERPMLAFETLTMAPIDLALVEPRLLTPEEKDWLNAYHRRVIETLAPLVPEDTRGWLAAATRPL
ncbi:aminopeptidase P family protein [Pedomonas mirosovicensis]|uniref:aminopeptidase P family protein n=1 Tax=Pedomonas mirosovicensis TaxID=2908641 RepID=UPI0021694BBC|nr:aminopeptidase P family protein [Pedomonas mirosovicensis]MCH8683758.1 aminopeptidase P family protein [Pedomonas mirosovicensis]